MFPQCQSSHQAVSRFILAAVVGEVFKKADISEEINVNGENLTKLRFADDVALFNENTKQMEQHLNSLISESLKMHKGKTKYMTNHADSEAILTDQGKK